MSLFHRVILSFNIVFALLFSYIPNSFASDSNYMFGGAEHIFIGDEIKLFFSSNDPGQTGYLFQLPSGLKATYGDMISFGDFYEILDKPISQGKSEAERKARFLDAFNSFALDPHHVKEATQILNVLHTEQKLVKEAVKRGDDPVKILKQQSSEIGRQLNCITGGGCMSSGWWAKPGRFLKLANVDYDHFGSHAWAAYQIGHNIAIQEAIKAGQTGDHKKLELAYAMNAFACHFLSDRFSSGHMRTPRLELSREVSPSITGSLLSGFMHNEENAYGLHVHNLRGDRWTAYGDRYYFSPANRTSLKLQREILQRSANQIFTAYERGFVQDDRLQELLPEPDEIGNASNIDVSPLFYWDSKSKKLMRRKNVGNVYDKRWTSDWWGWSTLTLLAKEHGLPPETQAKLAQSNYARKAMQDGLITDKAIIEYIKNSAK